MPESQLREADAIDATPQAKPVEHATALDHQWRDPTSEQFLANLAVGAVVAGALSACGGGSPETAAPTPPSGASISDAEASRFLAQAGLGGNRAEIARVRALGYSGWIDDQFAQPQTLSRWDWLVSKGYDAIANKNSEAGFDAATWRKLLSSSDVLRQRVTLALSEIIVTAIDGLVGGGWRQFAAAAYLDLLEANAFGNYRTLLQQVSTSAAMGMFLTFRGNTKANATTGSEPDENYAREVMQLFTIGLQQLNLDGSLKTSGGVPIETYGQNDITGLARVFTGWEFDLAGGDTSTPDFLRRPMTQIVSRHELGAKTFLGTTIAAGTNGVDSLRLALDTLFAHPNLAPFVSRQLIQRLVTSNPSPGYVARVAAVFNDDGSATKGNLKAVLKALLLDDEARSAAGLADPAFGKLREPMLRFVAWARAVNATSPTDTWDVGNTSDAGTRLAQSPLRSPTVFNFFRPGYVPPNSAIGIANLVGPELQITNESTVASYLNYMQRAVSVGVGVGVSAGLADVVGDYTALIPLADNPKSLIDELNTMLAAGQIGATTLATINTALDTLPSGSDAARRNRVYAALLLVLAAPEFIVQK